MVKGYMKLKSKLGHGRMNFSGQININGEAHAVMCTAHPQTGYEVQVRKPIKGSVWPLIDQFTMPGFTDKAYQDVEAPKLGKLRAIIAKNPDGSRYIKIQGVRNSNQSDIL